MHALSPTFAASSHVSCSIKKSRKLLQLVIRIFPRFSVLPVAFCGRTAGGDVQPGRTVSPLQLFFVLIKSERDVF